MMSVPLPKRLTLARVACAALMLDLFGCSSNSHPAGASDDNSGSVIRPRDSGTWSPRPLPPAPPAYPQGPYGAGDPAAGQTIENVTFQGLVHLEDAGISFQQYSMDDLRNSGPR